LKRIASLVTVVTAAAAALWLAVPAGAAPTSRPPVSGTENLQAMTTSATATTIPVIAYGVFTAAGVDHTDTSTNVDTLVFPNGSFEVNHSQVPTTQKLNTKTCLLQVSGQGPVTLFGGTGAYRGISGTLEATLSILAIAARSNGQCSMTAPPVAFQQIIKASGKVTL
jgi:hypothetical protein